MAEATTSPSTPPPSTLLSDHALHSLSTFQAALSSGTALPDLYTDLHARASRTRALFITLAPLAALHDRLASLAATDPARRLPLHGVPFVVKDNIDVAGLPTTAACPSFSRPARRSAFAVQQLEAAGAVALAKANMDQFATGLVGTRSPYGTPTNPHNAAYIPGGSSSGSAVALALRLCVFALATDTAGSGRVPAAMNGLVGLKPTRGLLSTTGVVPACASLDCVSILAHTVADAAFVLRLASRAYDDLNPFTRPVPPGKVVGEMQDLGEGAAFSFGVPSTPLVDFNCDAIAETSFNESVARLVEVGGNVAEVNMDPFMKSAELLYGGPFVAERYAAVGEFVSKKHGDVPSDFDPTVTSIILNGAGGSAVELFNAQTEIRRNIKVALKETWSRVDILVLPSIPRAFTLMDIERDPVLLNSILGTFTNFVNLMDYCAIAVPCSAGEYKSSVPRGVTFIAQAFEEGKLIDIAQRFRGNLENDQVKVPESSEAFREIPEATPDLSQPEPKQEDAEAEQQREVEVSEPKAEPRSGKPRFFAWLWKVRNAVGSRMRFSKKEGMASQR